MSSGLCEPFWRWGTTRQTSIFHISWGRQNILNVPVTLSWLSPLSYTNFSPCRQRSISNPELRELI